MASEGGSGGELSKKIMRKPTRKEGLVLIGASLSCGALVLASGLLLGERQKTAGAIATNQALMAAGAIQLTAEIAAPSDGAAANSLIAATSTLAATNTLEPTFTPLPAASATPLPIDRFISRRGDGSLIGIDQRDAWGSLPNFDSELAPAATQLNLWTDNLRLAYTTGVLGGQTVTTYEKLAETHGFIAKNFNLDFNWHPLDEFSRFSGELNSNGSLGIAATADRLSETMVRLSEELAELGRQKNPDGQVMTPDQIFQGITANLNLEAKWRPGIDPEKVDQIKLQCFTFRQEEGSERPDQPEVIEKDVWDQDLRPGVEIELGQEWVDAQGVGHFSNDGLIAVVVTVVPAAQLDGIKEVLAQENHQAAFTEIAAGWWAVTMEFDMSERSHSPQDAVEADQNRGSGGQLIECDSAVPAPGPEITPASATPDFRSPTPPPSPTGEISRTPKPTSISSPTNTERPPTATEHPSATVQNPTDAPSTTAGPTMPGTPTQPPTPTERQSTPETPNPTSNPPATETPWNPVLAASFWQSLRVWVQGEK